MKHAKLTTSDADKIERALNFAARQGWAPNLMVSLAFGCAPNPSIHPVKRLGLTRDAIKSWLRRWHLRHLGPAARAIPFVWLEVRENPPANGAKGGHEHEGAHLLLWVPDLPHCYFPADATAKSKFKTELTRAVRRNFTTGVDPALVKSGAVHIRTIDNLATARDYLLKGGRRYVRTKFGTLRFGMRKRDQGVVEGPRYRIAHAIGQTAQRAAARAALDAFQFKSAA